jgi:L-lysine exporter family protein LysE/ArgO
LDPIVETVLRNVLLGISVAAPIGPASLAIIQAGMDAGFGRAFATAIGAILADLTFLLVVTFGLASIVQRPQVQIGLWVGGAAVMIYLGLRSLQRGFSGLDMAGDERSIDRSPLLVGYAVNIANPVAIVWWVGIFGSLLAENADHTSVWASLLVASSILLGIFLWHTGLSLASHGGRRWLDGRVLRLVSGAAGLALIGFGIRFAGLAIKAIATASAG